MAKRLGGERIVIYGVGGIGKTSLAALAPKPLFFDLDGSGDKYGLTIAHDGNGDPISTWEGLRGGLQSDELIAPFDSVIIDSVTVAQRMAETYTIANVRHDKGQPVKSIEGYGYGKGFQHVLETFLCLLADLDHVRRQGKHVILVGHVVKERCPNPLGEDFLRWEPDLYQPPKTGRTRDAVANWCDHLLFVNYDYMVNDTGKALGGGSRTIWPQELPTHWAKSRKLRDPIVYTEGSDELWKTLLG